MLTQKSRYGLRALIYLAREGRSRSVATIAADEGISAKFLEAILVELKRHGLVASRRGKAGGYRLGRAAGAISFAEVIRALDGPLALAPCASRTAPGKCRGCKDPELCEIRPVLVAARDATARILEQRSLAEACGQR